MEYKIYSAEYKISLIEEFQSRNISMRAFCKEKNLSLSTLESWLRKNRIYGQIRCHEGKIGILKDLSSCFLSLKITSDLNYLQKSPSFIGRNNVIKIYK